MTDNVPSDTNSHRPRQGLGGSKVPASQDTSSPGHWQRVAGELRQLGVTSWGVFRIESHYLANFIHPDEHIQGVIYGKHASGFAVLAATDRRVVFLSKRALFSMEDEVGYDSVTGVTLNRTRFNSTVTLYTRVKEYMVKMSNARCAQGFVDFIERRCLDTSLPREQEALI